MQRELRAFANRSHKEQQTNRGQRFLRIAAFVHQSEHAVVTSETDRAEGREDQHDGETEADVTNTIDDKSLLGGIRGGSAFVVVTDQQIRTEAHAFPTEEDQEVV